MFPQFCMFLVNFGRNMHIFALPCIILLTFAVNFAKDHQKTRKMTVKMASKWSKMVQKGPKMVQKGLKMGSKRHQNDPEMMPKRCQNDP